MELDGLPPDTKCELVTIFSEHGRAHNIELLGPGQIYRKEQCEERFQHSIHGMVQKRAAAMRGMPGMAPRTKNLIVEHNKVQAELLLANRAAEEQGFCGQVVTKTHSSLNDDGDGQFVTMAPGNSRGRKTAAHNQGAAPLARKKARAGGNVVVPAQQLSRRKRLIDESALSAVLAGGIDAGCGACDASGRSRSCSRDTRVGTVGASVLDLGSQCEGTTTASGVSNPNGTSNIQEVLFGALLGRQLNSVQLFVLFCF